MIKKIFVCFSFVILAACSKKAPEGPKKTLLLVSLPPYQTLVQEIAGNEYEVQTVVPANADPHNYEPTSKQLLEISKGKIWFRIGEPFEEKVLPLLKNTEPHDLRENLSLIEGHCKHHKHEDRHLWLSPKLMAVQGNQVADILSESFPNEKNLFQDRLILLKNKLHKLDREIDEKLQKTSNRIFLVSHPAFAYFCRDYNCTQLSIEHEGKEPRPKELEATLNKAVETNASLAIALPQHNNKGAHLIAEKLQIPIHTIDPYKANYVDTMREITQILLNPNDQNERD